MPRTTLVRRAALVGPALRTGVMSARAADPEDSPTPLSRDEAIRYWDDRHRSAGDLRSGGHIGLSEAANEIFYRIRLGKLLELIGSMNAPAEPMFVLDAGCGKGRFARELAACGFCVDGIDTSAAAIAASRAAGGARFEVASITEWTSPTLYDVTMAIDVLFHILDDEEWAASLRNLASLTRLGGQLIVTDEDRDKPRHAGRYIVHRPRSAYARVLGDRFAFVGFTPYRFRENQVGFLEYRRVG